MGTRSVTHVADQEGHVYVSMYRQYDGYPQGGHGEELAKFLDGAVIGNGIGFNETRNFFNGVGDLACRLVAYFKRDAHDAGSFYLEPPNLESRQEYTYIVWADDGYDREGSVNIQVLGWSGNPMFEGTIDEFVNWIPRSEDEDY